MKKKVIIWVIVLIVIAGGGAAWWKLGMTEEKPAEAQPEAPPPPKIQVDVGEVKKTIYATGSIEAENRKEVSAEVDGKIKNVLVEEGQTVEKGDLLFTIDREEADLNYRQKQLEVQRLERELEDLRDLKAEIVAADGGEVTKIEMDEGDQVTEDQVVVELSQPDKLMLNAKFLQTQAAQMEEGKKVRLFLLDSLTFIEGTIDEIDKEGKATEAGAIVSNVKIVVENPGALHTSHKATVEYSLPNGQTLSSLGPVNFEAMEPVELKAQTTGEIKEVKIEEGQRIEKGDVIATIDMQEAEINLEEKELSLKQARLSLEEMQKNLSKHEVRAPISGEVTELNVEVGDSAREENPAVVIMDRSKMYMVASVEELDIPLIELGQKVDVYITAFGNQIFPGEVVEISDEGTTEDDNVSFEVKIAVEDNGKMMPGMTGDCDIIVNHVKDVPRLPYHAVQIVQDGQGTVMVPGENEGEPVPKQVEVGVEGMEFVEIKSGLSPGDEVVLMGGGGGNARPMGF